MITVTANLKGGSGKSTVAFNLAVWLEKQGQHVIGYDLDPQCTFSDLAMLRQEIGIKPDPPFTRSGPSSRINCSATPGRKC
jgi:chromosome partitioning protein